MLPPPTNDQDAGLLEHIITSDPLTRMNEVKYLNLKKNPESFACY